MPPAALFTAAADAEPTVLEWIGVVVAGLGSLLLLASAISSALGLTEWVSSRRFVRTPVMTCQELASVPRLPRRVLVTGRVRTGPAGPVTAPLSGGTGPWYSVQVRTVIEDEGTRSSVRSFPDVLTLEDGTGRVLLAGGALRTMLLDDDARTGITRGHFGGRYATDDELPALLPRLAALGLSVDRRRALSGDVTVYELRCHDAAPVTVLARPRRTGGGVMLAARSGDGSSVRSVQDLRRHTTGEAGDTLHTAGGLLVGALAMILPGYALVWLGRVFGG
jgi:hypothetical protein